MSALSSHHPEIQLIENIGEDIAVDVTPASKLCLACGLCCNGALHGRARLRSDEISLAESLGLTLIAGEPKGFHQPCACWQDGKCSVYDRQRPEACTTYRCKLLRGLDDGDMTFDDALEQVLRARALMDEITALLDERGAARACSNAGVNAPPYTIWQRAQHFAAAQGHTVDSVEFRRAHAQLALKLSTLHWLLERRFRNVNIPHKDTSTPRPDRSAHTEM